MQHTTTIIGHPDYSFNHCASIIANGSHPIIIGYCGRECTDEQRVFIYYKGCYHLLGPKTGNPIIWEHEETINILYSKFKDIAPDGSKPNTPVERWKYCSNYHAQISAYHFEEDWWDSKKKNVIESQSTEIDDMFGLLARCQPIVFNGECLIPMYREKDPMCEIWALKDGKIYKKSAFGKVTKKWCEENEVVLSNLGSGVAIQPTLAIVKDGLIAYMRNVSRSHSCAWYSKSEDGIKWSELKQSRIPNENNSLIYVNSDYEEHKYVIFNPVRDRSDIRLMSTRSGKSIPLGKAIFSYGRESYSYPNYAWNHDDLHIVHSNCGMIAHHILTKKYLEKTFG
jgi:hypothetical protein